MNLYEIRISYTHPTIKNRSWQVRREREVLRSGLRSLVFAFVTMEDAMLKGFISTEMISKIGGNVTTASYFFREGTSQEVLKRVAHYMNTPKYTVSLLTWRDCDGRMQVCQEENDSPLQVHAKSAIC